MPIGTIISTALLTILLIVCMIVSLTVIVVQQKTKLKLQAELMAANEALTAITNRNTTNMSRLDKKRPDDVDTSDNVAYSRSDEVTMKQREVKTRDNVAYDVIG